MPAHRVLLLALACTASAAACGSSFGHRSGPAFAVAFPDPTVLVTTTDPVAVRATLSNVQLPSSSEHHDLLRRLLRERSEIQPANLILLVEAIAVPENGATVTSSDGKVRVYAARGQGPCAAITDELLRDGAAKLVGVDRLWLGELIGRSQTDATMSLLADKFLPALDDGSETALREILAGLSCSPASSPFLVDYLAAKGRLDGERGFATVAMLSFDDQRVALVRALASRPGKIGGDRLLKLAKGMSFDAGRTGALAAVSKRSDFRASHEELTALSASCSFDQARDTFVLGLAGALDGAPTGATAVALLRTFSFDQGRLAAVRSMRPHWQNLPASDHQALLATFSFDSSRQQAAALLH